MREIIQVVNEDMGGVSAPMSTLANTPGVGNAVPAASAAMTGAEQASSDAIGSGDKWDNTSAKKKKKKKITEEDINPHDKIGVDIAKELDVPVNFEKSGQGTKQKVVSETMKVSKIIPFEDWTQKNE